MPKAGWGMSIRARYKIRAAALAGWREVYHGRDPHQDEIDADHGGGYRIVIDVGRGKVCQTGYSDDYLGALHMSANTAEMTAMAQAMLLLNTPPYTRILMHRGNVVHIFVDSTYTLRYMQQTAPKVNRDSSNVAMGSTLRQIRELTQTQQGIVIQASHVKGHAAEKAAGLPGGSLESQGNEDADFEATAAMNEMKGGTPRRVHTLATVMPGGWGDGTVRKRRRRAAAAVDVNAAFVPLSESERRQIRCSPSRQTAGRRKAAGRPKGVLLGLRCSHFEVVLFVVSNLSL